MSFRSSEQRRAAFARMRRGAHALVSGAAGTVIGVSALGLGARVGSRVGRQLGRKAIVVGGRGLKRVFGRKGSALHLRGALSTTVSLPQITRGSVMLRAAQQMARAPRPHVPLVTTTRHRYAPLLGHVVGAGVGVQLARRGLRVAGARIGRQDRERRRKARG